MGNGQIFKEWQGEDFMQVKK